MGHPLGNTVLDHMHVLPTSHSSHTKPVKYEYNTVVINFGSILESTEASFKNTHVKPHHRGSNLIVLDGAQISVFLTTSLLDSKLKPTLRSNEQKVLQTIIKAPGSKSGPCHLLVMSLSLSEIPFTHFKIKIMTFGLPTSSDYCEEQTL